MFAAPAVLHNLSDTAVKQMLVVDENDSLTALKINSNLSRTQPDNKQTKSFAGVTLSYCAGFIKQSMGAKNRVGIGLSYSRN
jgi:hypothetical protein